MRRLVLESWDGKTPNEIAAELDCHPKTVRIHLARFNAEGINGLGMREGAGRKPRLRRSGAQPASRPSGLSVEPEQMEALLSGEQDVWVAGCANFYASPFGKPGFACPVPIWGCLECPNAVITSRHLPTLLLFLNRMVAERERLEERAWAAQFGRAYTRIVQQILPAFPTDVVTAARAMLEASTPVLALPPNLALLRQTP
jgi:Winged helix-turn helix